MKLEQIGFYTLEDKRAKEVNKDTPLWRCELILTDKCNFKCPYCRGLRKDCEGEMPLEKALEILNIWFENGLKNVRFSGGEPTLYPYLRRLVRECRDNNVEHIAISTNGSMPFHVYEELVESGVNDFSISLDACCSSFADKMAGTNSCFNNIRNNIEKLSGIEGVFVSVGVVVNEDNIKETNEIIKFADSLNVSDIRIISAAQFNEVLKIAQNVNEDIINRNPILKYRVNNIKNNRNVRGIKKTDCHKCHLVKDDIAVAGKFHFPCIIYMREQGDPIGIIDENVREERMKWFEKHDSFKDEICRKNCLDVCIDYNNKVEEFRS